ncbi:MAG: hypothetical protein FJ038_12875 [Chloroflexi bacterium]|nr:hypothetical protein [Chloroflexota bacterium]
MTSRTMNRGRLNPALEVLDRALIVTVIVFGLVAVLAVTAGPADALTVKSATVARIGGGAARLTTYTNGAGSLYVNLKNLAPGTRNERLWSGTCSSLGTRVAILPGLIVPASGALARTNVLTAGQARGRTLRIVRGSRALCTTFGSGSAASPSPSPSGSASTSPSGSASASPSASPSATASGSPSASASDDD